MLQPPALYLLGLVALVLARSLEGAIGEDVARLVAVIAFNVVLFLVLDVRLNVMPSFAGVCVGATLGALVAAPSVVGATEFHVPHAVAALLVLAAVAWEELLFRGVAFDFTRARYGDYGAIALSSIAFAGAHLLDPAAATPLAVAYLVAGGVLLGLVRAYYESIWPALVLHAAHNLVLACVIDEGPPWGSIVVAVTACVAVGWRLAQRRREPPAPREP